MENERRFLYVVLCVAVLGLGLVFLAGVHGIRGNEPPRELWQLLAAVFGALIALIPQWPRDRPKGGQ